ncbi:helix-turn-helix transcriptional regulator [Candidatus Roizmanbacteria bacterium]|nr:helix-turn-helix transcriptional regulator [Candidatus Roizmanbacteria bacterium]
MLSKSKFTEIVGANIRKIRTKKRLSQDELAHRCGFYRTYINLVETAKRTPSSYTLYRIAKTIRVKVDDLYPSTV